MPLTIRIASPSEVGGRIETQRLWGDHWVKAELADAFRAMGHTVVEGDPDDPAIDVLLHLSGGGIAYIFKRPIEQIAPHAHKIAWVYSHPEKVTPTSLKGYHRIFCCSVPFADKMRAMGYCVSTLLGATNKRPLSKPITHDVAFVGGTRGPGGRPIINDLMAAKLKDKRITIWGPGWERYIPRDWYGGRYYPYPELGGLYAASKICLQDHRPEMADAGFVSVKIYDILASGSLPVCAPNVGIQGVFKGAVPEYTSPKHLREIIEHYCAHEDERRALIAQGQAIALNCTWAKRAELLIRGVTP